MEKELALYALALALVPDEDVAGDLFMDARTEQGLLRAANAWRRRQGLEPVDLLPPTLPSLTPLEAEHARHLRRRAGLRSRVRLTAAAVLAAAVCVGGAVWLADADRPVLSWAQAGSLAGDLAFRSAPLAQDTAETGPKLAIYKLEPTPGGLTVLWELTGPGVADQAGSLTPQLYLGVPPVLMEAAATERESPRSNRVVGRTRYKLLVTTEAGVEFRVPRLGQTQVNLSVNAVLRPDLTGPAVLPLNKQIQAGPATITLEQLALYPDRSVLRYRRSGPANLRGPYPYMMVGGGGRWTPDLVPSRRQSAGGGPEEATFSPLRTGSTDLEIHFSSAVEFLGPRTILLQAPEIEDARRNGDTFDFFLVAENEILPMNEAAPYVTDRSGRQYVLRLDRERSLRPNRLHLTARQIPQEAELVYVTLPNVGRTHAAESFTIRLVP